MGHALVKGRVWTGLTGFSVLTDGEWGGIGVV